MIMVAALTLGSASAFAGSIQRDAEKASVMSEMSGQDAKSRLRADIKRANAALQEVVGDDFAFNNLALSGNYLVCTFNFIDFGYIDQSDADEFAIDIFREFKSARQMVQNAYKAGVGLKVVVKTTHGSRTYTYGNKVFLKL